MREITGHKVNDCNEAISITADDRDERNGNASHRYRLNFSQQDGAERIVEVDFQHGPIKEVGVNGITNEALLAIVIDRLEGFQAGPYACSDNEGALFHLVQAQKALFARTRERLARGVEGTHEV